MIATVAAMIPAAAGLFAIAAIVFSVLRYGPLALSLREELAACETTRELRYMVVTLRVTGGAEQQGAVRLPADRRGQYQPIHRQARRPAQLPALRAAA